MKTALIGYTGFVGSTLLAQTTFDDKYNSRNITDIQQKEYDLVVCAGVSAVKWLANKEPEKDWEGIQYLLNNIQLVKAKKFVHISTIDVYPTPLQVNEDTIIDPTRAEPYGKHRYQLEQIIQELFDNTLILRLPALFGTGLKKNFIYDLIHTRMLDYTHPDSSFPFYNMDNLWKDISIAKNAHLSCLNLAVEPLTAGEIAKNALQIEIQPQETTPIIHYDMHSKYSSLFNAASPYLYSKEYTLDQIIRFIKKEKKNLHL